MVLSSILLIVDNSLYICYIIRGGMMIEKIEININNGCYNRINALIDYSNKKCYLNNNSYKVDNTFLEELKKILYTFKKEYGSINTIDIEEFEILVTSKNHIDRYHGKGKYPNNYKNLINLLEGLK